mgnify:CR=1 FL=1
MPSLQGAPDPERGEMVTITRQLEQMKPWSQIWLFNPDDPEEDYRRGVRIQRKRKRYYVVLTVGTKGKSGLPRVYPTAEACARAITPRLMGPIPEELEKRAKNAKGGKNKCLNAKP